MNKVLNFFKSNLVPSLDEVAGNLKYVHNKNLTNSVNVMKNASAAKKAGLDFSEEVLNNAKVSGAWSKDVLSSTIDDSLLKEMDVTPKMLEQSHRQQVKRFSNPDYSSTSVRGAASDASEMAMSYFLGNGVSKTARNTRLGVAGAGVAGAMTGGRFISGGSLTHNNKGEKDIMGVPFI